MRRAEFRLPRRKARVSRRLSRFRLVLQRGDATPQKAANPPHSAPAAPPPSSAGKQPGLQPPPPLRLFSPQSFWNAPLAPDAPLDPESAALSAQLRDMAAAGAGRRHRALDRDQPLHDPALHRARRPAHGAGGAAKRRPRLAPHPAGGAFDAVPIPPGARPAAGSDGHMTIWQPATDKLWEFWQARKDAQGNWHADFGGAIEHVSQSPGYYTRDSWPGGGLLLGGDGEQPAGDRGNDPPRRAASGHIDHALAMDIPMARAGVFSWPAQRTDGFGGPDAIPEGARFRLDPNLDIAALHLPPLVAMMAERRAALRDRGARPDRRRQRDRLLRRGHKRAGRRRSLLGRRPPARRRLLRRRSGRSTLMAKFPWERLELLKMKLCSGPAWATCPWATVTGASRPPNRSFCWFNGGRMDGEHSAGVGAA